SRAFRHDASSKSASRALWSTSRAAIDENDTVRYRHIAESERAFDTCRGRRRNPRRRRGPAGGARMNSPLFDLQGRVIVVTGGAKGLGKTYSRALTGLGAKVTIADVDGAECDALAAEIGKSGGEAL